MITSTNRDYLNQGRSASGEGFAMSESHRGAPRLNASYPTECSLELCAFDGVLLLSRLRSN